MKKDINIMATTMEDPNLPRCKVHTNTYTPPGAPLNVKLPEPCSLICVGCLLGKTTPDKPVKG
jgi:hypothetical protein